MLIFFWLFLIPSFSYLLENSGDEDEEGSMDEIMDSSYMKIAVYALFGFEMFVALCAAISFIAMVAVIIVQGIKLARGEV